MKQEYDIETTNPTTPKGWAIGGAILGVCIGYLVPAATLPQEIGLIVGAGIAGSLFANEAEYQWIKKRMAQTPGDTAIDKKFGQKKPRARFDPGKNKGEEIEEEKEESNEQSRPEMLQGATQRISTGYGDLYVHINEDPEKGRPYELFANISNSGGFAASFTEALAKTVSVALRSGTDPRKIADELQGIRSPKVGWDEGEQINSIPDAIGTALRRYLDNEVEMPPASPPEKWFGENSGEESKDNEKDPDSLSSESLGGMHESQSESRIDRDDLEINLETLQTIREEERKSDSITDLPESFYTEVSTYLDDLRDERTRVSEELEDTFDSEEVEQLTEKIEKIQQEIELIYERRTGKLVEFTSKVSITVEKFTPEERELFYKIIDTIIENRKKSGIKSDEEIDLDPLEDFLNS